MFPFPRDSSVPYLLLGLGFFSFPAPALADLPFTIETIALTDDDGTYGPLLGPGVTFAGFGGSPTISGSGDVAFPGTLNTPDGGSAEGYWLNSGGSNSAIALTNEDGDIGPGLGNGVFLDNVIGDAIVSDGGDILMGGFITGSGVNDSNNFVWLRHTSGVNVPITRNGVATNLGPGLGGQIVYNGFFVGPQINAGGVVLFQAGIEGQDVDSTNDLGFWRNTVAGNAAILQTGVTGTLGPGLGADTVFVPVSGNIGRHQLLNGSSDVVFAAQAQNSQTGVTDAGIWRNEGGVNSVLALSGEMGDLGPGLAGSFTFADVLQLPLGDLEFHANHHGDLVFAFTLDNGTRGIWRNLGERNEPLMLAGETGALGPGLGPQDTFADFSPQSFFPGPVISGDQVALFPGELSGSSREGLWLNAGNGNEVVAITEDDGGLGPGLGPGITFTGFNRAYFGDSNTVYFTADLSIDVPSNRLLGLWAYQGGEIQKIAVYGELFDVDPSGGVDERLVRWVQIPSDSALNEFGANDSNEVAFRMGFQDGTQGIFVARVVPEPRSDFLLVVATLSLTMIYREHRR